MQATGHLPFTLRLSAGRLGSRFPLSVALVGGHAINWSLVVYLHVVGWSLAWSLVFFCHRHDASSLGFLEKSLPGKVKQLSAIDQTSDWLLAVYFTGEKSVACSAKCSVLT